MVEDIKSFEKKLERLKLHLGMLSLVQETDDWFRIPHQAHGRSIQFCCILSPHIFNGTQAAQWANKKKWNQSVAVHNPAMSLTG